MPRTNPVQLAHVLRASGARVVDREIRVHPDTYPTHLSGFLTYDGEMMPQSHEWTDAHIPRTDRPVRFYRAFTPGGNSRKYLYPSRIHA